MGLMKASRVRISLYPSGELAERLNALASKARERLWRSTGSNPVLSVLRRLSSLVEQQSEELRVLGSIPRDASWYTVHLVVSPV